MSKVEEKVHWERGKDGEYFIIGIVDDSLEEKREEIRRKMKSLDDNRIKATKAVIEARKRGREALIWSVIALTISTIALLLQLLILLKRLGLI